MRNYNLVFFFTSNPKLWDWKPSAHRFISKNSAYPGGSGWSYSASWLFFQVTLDNEW